MMTPAFLGTSVAVHDTRGAHRAAPYIVRLSPPAPEEENGGEKAEGRRIHSFRLHAAFPRFPSSEGCLSRKFRYIGIKAVKT